MGNLHKARAAALIIAIVVFGTPSRSPGQADDPHGPVVTSLTRHDDDAFASPRAVKLLDAAGLSDLARPDSAAASMDLPGIWTPRRFAAGGSPIMRGMMGRQVLVLLDGVPLNNAISRPGAHPLLSIGTAAERPGPDPLLSTIDALQLSRIEAVGGPGSVVFGSGALGGVINLRRELPTFSGRRAWDVSARAIARYHGEANALVTGGSVEGHLRQLGVRLAGSLRRFDELSTGDAGDAQRFTEWRDGAGAVTAAWRLPSGTLALSYDTVRLKDAGLSDRSTARDFSIVSDRSRDMLALRYRHALDLAYLERIDATVSFQSQREQRERFVIDGDRIAREQDNVSSLGASVALRTQLPYNRLSYGVDLFYDRVGSAAEQESIGTRTLTQFDRGRYVDGSDYLRFGVYTVDRLAFGRFAFDLGGRLLGWHAAIAGDPALLPPIDVTRVSGVASLHGRYLLGDGLNLVAGLAQGYRAPNVDDYSASGCRDRTYDLPNGDLRAERSLTAEAGVKLDLFGILQGSLFYYFTHIDDMIVAIEDGRAPEGAPCGTRPDGSPRATSTTRRSNALRGRLHGIEGELAAELPRGFRIFSSLSWTRGTASFDDPPLDDEALDRVPPLNGLAGVRFTAGEQAWFAELAVRWAARQDRLGLADRKDVAICPVAGGPCEGTAGFAVFDLRGAAKLHRMVRLTLSLQNLTDTRYRLHGAGIIEGGLRVMAGLEVDAR